jgi:hypothetical protein
MSMLGVREKFSPQENFGMGLDKGAVVVYTVGG